MKFKFILLSSLVLVGTKMLADSPAYDLKFDKSICEGETYTWEGRTLNESGTYVDIYQSESGQDSIRTLKLTVNPIIRKVLNETICDKDAYFFKGDSLRKSGTYIDTLAAQTGCDSIVTLNLKVNKSYKQNFEKSICKGDECFWNGRFLTETGTYVDTLPTEAGCDSIIILKLTVNPTYSFDENQTICKGETYSWHGQSLTETGVYYDRNTTAKGCDSTYTLHLTVNPTYNLKFDETICEGSTYSWEGRSLDKSGTYADTFQTKAGCDSIRTLKLTVLPKHSANISETICEGFTYSFGNTSKTYEAGSYTLEAVEPGINGCDSTTVLKLTVNPVNDVQLYDTAYSGEAYDKYGFEFDKLGSKGDFVYTHNLSNAYDCDSVVTLNLAILSAEEKEAPTVFSPSNEDGVNDVFMAGYEVYIYDRYGNLVCHSEDGWDGRYRGKFADAGIYVYAVKMKNNKMKKGTIEVLKD